MWSHITYVTSGRPNECLAGAPIRNRGVVDIRFSQRRAQFGGAKTCNRIKFTRLRRQQCVRQAIQLAASVVGCVRCMYENARIPAFYRFFDFRETGHDIASFVRQSQILHGRTAQQARHKIGYIRVSRNRLFESAGKSLAANSFGNSLRIRHDPHAASRQLPFYVWHNPAVRVQNEA